MKISGGMTEGGVVVGNAYDKYGSRNPIVRWLMRGFEDALTRLVKVSGSTEIHEIGCGEGHWVMEWNRQGFHARGSDFSAKVIEFARKNSLENDLAADCFKQQDIYDLGPEDSADLIVCCEVMEHLEHPEEGLSALRKIVRQHLILSVPREPLWRVLNVCRGKYWSDFGNTPGHLQHWSRSKFVDLVSEYFDILIVETPVPWTMILCRAKADFETGHG